MIIWVTEAGASSMEGKTANCHVVEWVARALEMARNWFDFFSIAKIFTKRSASYLSSCFFYVYLFAKCTGLDDSCADACKPVTDVDGSFKSCDRSCAHFG